ncbi:MAG: BspA family leucine-rich repeat surface protein [Defluviitaleaceae bacterium]|nr:BspA family leucine-rich repeat surface protein [Defluviitaleaceae bacterium]
MYKFSSRKIKLAAAAMALLISAGSVPSYAMEEGGESFVPNSLGGAEKMLGGIEGVRLIATATAFGEVPLRLYEGGFLIVGGGYVGESFSGNYWLNISWEAIDPNEDISYYVEFRKREAVWSIPFNRIMFIETFTIQDASFLFAHLFPNLVSLEGLYNLNIINNPNSPYLTSIQAMFFNTHRLLTNLDFTDFDTSEIFLMDGLFMYSTALTSLDLSGFDTSNVSDMSFMFQNTSSLENVNLSSFDTSNVVAMNNMFENATSLSKLDLSSFDTRNVYNMTEMFKNASSLERLDLSSFNTIYIIDESIGVNYVEMINAFYGTYNLREFVLGENFKFSFFNFIENDYTVSPALPPVPNNETFTGFWQNVGSGTVDNPLGEFIFTSEELMLYYDGSTMADTWVWQPREPKEEDESEIIQSTNLRVLTINPHNNSNHFFARWFEEWVNGKGGSNQRLSKNINLNPLNSYGAPKITFEQVTTYELSRNPNHKKFVDIEELLRDDQGNYRFDIIAIGSWDFGGILRPGNEPHIIQAVSDFMDAGGAVIFGHDTLTDRHRTSHGRGTTAQTTFGTAHGTLQDGEFYRNRLNRLYGMNYLFAPLAHRAGIIPSQRVDRFAHHSNTANRKFAIITEQGPLTSFPFNFEVGQIIPISATHNNGSLTRGTVWAQFIERHNTGALTDIISNITGNFRLNPYRNMPTGNTIVNFPGRYITAEEWGSRHANERYAQNNWQAAGTYQSNAFISTYLNTAHIQSWRRVQYLTLEERKLFINTLFYLANISSIN